MVEGSLPFRTGGMPPPGRGIPLSGRGILLSGPSIPLSGRGIPPARRDIPPAGRGIPPAGRGIPPGVQLMIQDGRGIPPAGRGMPYAGRSIPPDVQLMIQAGRGMPAATGEVLDARDNLNLIRNFYTHNTSIVMSTDVMSTDRADNRPRTEEALTNFRVNLTVPTTITNNVPETQETPMRTLNALSRNVSTSNVSRRNCRARITPYSREDSANQKFLPR